MTSCLELFALSAFEPPSEWLDAVAVATALRLAPPSAALSNGGSRRTADRQRMGPQDICSLLSVFAAHPGGFLLLPTRGEGPAADVEPAASAAAATAAASPPPPPLLELLLREAARQAASFSPGQVLQLLTAVSELRGSGASGSGKSASSSSSVTALGDNRHVGRIDLAAVDVDAALRESRVLSPMLGVVAAATAEFPSSMSAVDVACLLKLVAGVGVLGGGGGAGASNGVSCCCRL